MKEQLEADQQRMTEYLDKGNLPFATSFSDVIKDCIILMTENCIAAIPVDETEVVPSEAIEKIMDSLRYLESVFWETEFDQNFSAFGQDYAALAFNWNGNLVKNELIESQTVLLTKLFSMKMSVEQIILACKHLLQKVRSSGQYSTPTATLSRNFLEKLLTKE